MTQKTILVYLVFFQMQVLFMIFKCKLFDLVVSRGSTVTEMAPLGWEVSGGAWVWRRRLLAWEEEEEVRECSALLLCPFHNTWHSWLYYACQCIILSLNILNNILEKIMKNWYFESTHRDESNDILYDSTYLCILVEKYG